MSKIVRKDTDSDGVEVNIMYAFGRVGGRRVMRSDNQGSRRADLYFEHDVYRQQ